MIDLVNVEEGHTLAAYGGYPELAAAVRELEGTAAPARAVRRLNGRTVWMVNSTAHGGGVAEMMPVIVSLLRQLGVYTGWAVIGPHDGRFFPSPSASTTSCTAPANRIWTQRIGCSTNP
jgi:trehalose synthase